jgi:hypothetical protein
MSRTSRFHEIDSLSRNRILPGVRPPQLRRRAQPSRRAERIGRTALAGSPIRSWAIDAGTAGFDKTKLADLVLLVKYSVL